MLHRIADGQQWLPAARAQFGGQGSLGNGAAMRVAPVALLAPASAERAAALGRQSAMVTHTHHLGTEGAALQAAAVALALNSPDNGPIDTAQFLDMLTAATANSKFRARLVVIADLVERRALDEIERRLGCGISALESVPTAICSFLLHPDPYRDAVRLAISLGGDTDTIAAMTGAAVGARVGTTGIPVTWMHRSEGSKRMTETRSHFY